MWFNKEKYPYANTLQSLDKGQNEALKGQIAELSKEWTQYSEKFLSEHPAFSTNPLARELPVGKRFYNSNKYWGWAATKAVASGLTTGFYLTSIDLLGKVMPTQNKGFFGWLARTAVVFGAAHCLPFLFKNPRDWTDRGARDVEGCFELGLRSEVLEQRICKVRNAILEPYAKQIMEGKTGLGKLSEDIAFKIAGKFINPEDRPLYEAAQELESKRRFMCERAQTYYDEQDYRRKLSMDRPVYRYGISRGFHAFGQGIANCDKLINERIIQLQNPQPAPQPVAPAAEPAKINNMIAGQLHSVRVAPSRPTLLGRSGITKALRDLFGGKDNDTQGKTNLTHLN